ncbi:MAG: hypothetical protein ABI880_10380 [Acidobacteriota bacterium]
MPVPMRFLAARLLVAALVLAPAMAAAQSLGTLTWQLQPFCNRLTLTIDQSGSTYSLQGFDDQCGVDPGRRAAAVGTAVLNGDGSVELGVTIVTAPSGRAVHVDARVSPATGQGTWRDDAENAGTFALDAATGGPERREPTSAPAPGSYIDVTGASLMGSHGFGVIVTSPIVAQGAAIYAQWGEAPSPSAALASAVQGVSRDHVGVAGVSSTSVGVFGGSTTAEAVMGFSSAGAGLSGYSVSGPAVRATYVGAGPGVALDLGNGGIWVGGPVRPAFQHTVTVSNASGNLSFLDHPLLNGQPSAMVLVTHVFGPGSNVYVPAVGVYYDVVAARWAIYREDVAAMPVNAKFNVLVVNQ